MLLLFLSLVVFISKRSGSYTIYRRNARVLEMQNFIPAYMKGWTYVRTIFSETKFLGCTGYQFSYPWCSAARASRARGPLKSWVGCVICCANGLCFNNQIVESFCHSPLKTRKVLEPKCVLQLFLGSLLGMQRTAVREL